MENSITWKADRLPKGAYFLVTPRPSALRESAPTMRTTQPPPVPQLNLSESTLGSLRAEVSWLRQQPDEHFVFFSLTESGDVCGHGTRTDGKAKECNIDITSVAREAASPLGAKWLVCLHNHPSKTVAEPSDEDRDLTDQLREALPHYGLRLFDHIIIASRSGHPFSFREEHMPMPIVNHDYERRQRLLDERGY